MSMIPEIKSLSAVVDRINKFLIDRLVNICMLPKRFVDKIIEFIRFLFSPHFILLIKRVILMVILFACIVALLFAPLTISIFLGNGAAIAISTVWTIIAILMGVLYYGAKRGYWKMVREKFSKRRILSGIIGETEHKAE